MRNKLRLTKKLVDELSEEDRLTVAQAKITWWHNFRNSGGMRLTSMGYRAFCDSLEITAYEYEIADPTEFNQQMILDLDRKIQTPYYISIVKGIPKKVIFFGSKEAIMVKLYGDLKRYLDNYQP
jgi:hypothetical protein